MKKLRINHICLLTVKKMQNQCGQTTLKQAQRTIHIRDVTKRLKQGINEEDIDYIQISIGCTTSIKYKNIIYNARLKDTNK